MDAQLAKSFQDQMNVERYNSAAYRALAYQLDSLAWDGTSHFMHKSSDDEQTHADKFADFLIAMNIVPEVEPLRAVDFQASDLLNAVTAAYNLEVKTTANINKLYLAADEAAEPQACQFLHWFLDEQTHSVKEVYDMVTELKRADCPAALLALDEKYGEK